MDGLKKVNPNINQRKMKINKEGIDLIKSSEGISLEAYVDPGSGNLPITIGFGSTHDERGNKFKLGDIITEERATELLLNTLSPFELGVDSITRDDITENQFSALVCFSYNVGLQNLKSSTLLKKVNLNPNDISIKEEFKKWNKSCGKVLKGLTLRRQKESELYFK